MIRGVAYVIQRYFPFRGGSEYYTQVLAEHAAAGDVTANVFTTNAWDLEYFWDPMRRHLRAGRTFYNDVAVYRSAVQHLPVASVTHRAIRRAMAEFSHWVPAGHGPLLRTMARFGPWIPDFQSKLDIFGQQVDVVHASNIAFESMLLSAEQHARRINAAFIITPNLHIGEKSDSAVRRYYTMPHQVDLLRRADHLLPLTSIEAEYLESLGVHADRITVGGVGLNVRDVTGGNGERLRHQHCVHGPLIIALGAAARDKGTIHTAEAVRILNQNAADPVTLMVAGPLLSEFERYHRELDDNDRQYIRMLGFVSDNDRRDLLDAADVLVLASRTDAYGYVLLEAWANETPVIGANAGGIPAVISHGENGMLVPFGDVSEIAKAIHHLIYDDAAAEMGTKGRKKIVSGADWYRTISGVYESIR